ncbi:hypothetical protein FG386_002845 [Cryptosporidium ryanae]|uniref:uncharacterized protein n=1 Tax=Cryptosporidium ryanae TaxID=515981 RepID=UPI00351A7DD1|nr:hypothetical protein FG386_002845 [Cryptosporidium ryanae]
MEGTHVFGSIGASGTGNETRGVGIEDDNGSCGKENVNKEGAESGNNKNKGVRGASEGESGNRSAGYGWCNELLAFPTMFNSVFTSLYRCNEYIDQRWLLVEDNYTKLVDLLLEMSRTTLLEDEKNNLRSKFDRLLSNGVNTEDTKIVVEETSINKEGIAYELKSNEASNFQHIGCVKNEIEIEIDILRDKTKLKRQDECILDNQSFPRKMQVSRSIYCDLYNKYQTCVNDIDITFERKEELLIELSSRLKLIISSIETFMKNNPGILESNIKPMYNISNAELIDLNVAKKKPNARGRPPGSVSRGRPPGSTNSKNSLTKKNIIKRAQRTSF